MKRHAVSILVMLLLTLLGCEPPEADLELPDTTLRSLIASTGTLVPAFDPSVTIYSLRLGSQTESVTITGVATDSEASLSDASGLDQSLSVGDTIVTITVTGSDGETTRDYAVTVTRASSADPTLYSLAASVGTLVPDFASDVQEYVMNLDSDTSAITFTGTLNDSDGSMDYSGVERSLSVGRNLLTVWGNSQDGKYARIYYIYVYRPSASPSSSTLGDLVQVPGGRFQRDSTAANITTLCGYKMSPHEITRAQFQSVMGTDPSDDSYSASATTAPVQNVNFFHALAFCNKLSLLEGLTPAYSVSSVSDWDALTFDEIPTTNDSPWLNASRDFDVDGYYLPTEMQWMWAAMGAPSDGQDGGIDTSGYAKSFSGSTGSNAIGDYAWYYSNASSKSHEVGTKLPNELGLYDMSGNVYEMCWDLYSSNYWSGSQVEYVCPDTSASSAWRHVMRGGYYFSYVQYCTVAYREQANYAYNQDSHTGFRVARP